MNARYVFDGQWRGFEIFASPKGWRLEKWSAIQGCTTGRKVFVPYGGNFEQGADMAADWNEHISNAEYFAEFAEQLPGARILNSGHRVL
ncbi:MAG: hypothetical protein PHE55_20330 [Methylococcaceae bacterium]|nr:hypothetical protein [Methylococcaceae bacterium]